MRPKNCGKVSGVLCARCRSGRETAQLTIWEGNVLVRRYFFAESIADIARRYGLTENHVTVMLSRTRKKLKAHLLKEGYR